GWSGPFLLLMPGIVLYTQAVMLNVPAMALSTAALYHGRRWVESRSRGQLLLAGAFVAAATLTYYLAAIVVSIFVAWILLSLRKTDLSRPVVRICALGGAILIALGYVVPWTPKLVA